MSREMCVPQPPQNNSATRVEKTQNPSFLSVTRVERLKPPSCFRAARVERDVGLLHASYATRDFIGWYRSYAITRGVIYSI